MLHGTVRLLPQPPPCMIDSVVATSQRCYPALRWGSRGELGLVCWVVEINHAEIAAPISSRMQLQSVSIDIDIDKQRDRLLQGPQLDPMLHCPVYAPYRR